MPRVTFTSKHISTPPVIRDVAVGTNLMAAIIGAGLPVGTSCGGIGICAKCFVTIVDGIQNLSKPNATEKKLIARETFDAATRISCQAKVLGPITVTTSYW